MRNLKFREACPSHRASNSTVISRVRTESIRSPSEVHPQDTPLSPGRGSPKRTGREGKTGLGPLRKEGRTLWSQKGVPSPVPWLPGHTQVGHFTKPPTGCLQQRGPMEAPGLREQETGVDIQTLLLTGSASPSHSPLWASFSSGGSVPGPRVSQHSLPLSATWKTRLFLLCRTCFPATTSPPNLSPPWTLLHIH